MCKLFFFSVPIRAMPASAFATITPFLVVSSCEYNKSFLRVIVIVVGQAGELSFPWLVISHGVQVRIFTVDSSEQQPVDSNGFDI
jgi:hypothetical protein